MENLPVPKRPRDNLIVFLSVLTVATILAMVGRLTSSDVTVMTAAVVGRLAAWTRFGGLASIVAVMTTATPMSS